LLAVLCLTGCPWIGGSPPGDDADTDVDLECIDLDFDGVCDDADDCVDGIDDITDRHVLSPGQPVTDWVCGDEESIFLGVDAGCSYTIAVDAPSTVGVEIIEDSYILASGPASMSFEGVSASFDVWEVLLFGNDDAYTVSAQAQCPSCGVDLIHADWGDVVSARLCPWSNELTIVMNTVRPGCDYGANLVTSDRTTTTLVVSDGVFDTSISDDSGYLSIVSPVSSGATEVRAVISQPSGVNVEQGVLLELAEYCN
jgi:hypothetical protein